MKQISKWSFVLTLIAAFTVTFGVAARSFGATYEIGPGKAYQAIGAVPWTTLAPGDTVKIYWRTQPYQEKILISVRGTAASPIQIVGIPGPHGELPVLDGKNATTGRQFQFPYAGTQDRGVVVFTRDTPHPWGYKPGYVVLQGLDIRNADTSNSFTDGKGALRTYTGSAAAIFVERGEHITVRGCTITGSCNGFFVASGGEEETQSRDILVDGCHIYGNGVVGSDRQHNIYTECIGVTFQYNLLGRPRTGALGNNLKDRSAGTVIRYNWIEGGAHLLDLVEAQDSWPITGQNANYHQAFVYGNIFLNQTGDGASLVHYGGDNGDTRTYRKGALYFYDNTVVIQCDQKDRWRTLVFQLATNDETADVRNNILFSAPATAGAARSEFTLLGPAGVCNFGVNWVSSGWLASPSGDPRYSSAGTLTGTGNFISTTNGPGFANLFALDLHLAPGSACIAKAGAAAPAVMLGQFDPTMEYVALQAGMPRPEDEKSTNLGAFGSLSGATAPVAPAPVAPAPVTSAPIIPPPPVVPAPVTSTYSVSGKITSLGKPTGWIPVRGGGLTTKTAPDGTYTLSGLRAGSYTISAIGSFYTFTLPQTVTVGPNQSNINFTASLFVSGITLAPSTITDGKTMVGTATVNSPAPLEGLYVPLFCSNPCLSLERPYVFIPPSATSATFTVSTTLVKTSTAAQISAIYDGQWAFSNTLTVKP